jgi:hypothetical protein
MPQLNFCANFSFVLKNNLCQPITNIVVDINKNNQTFIFRSKDE